MTRKEEVQSLLEVVDCELRTDGYFYVQVRRKDRDQTHWFREIKQMLDPELMRERLAS
jgi:hypothetical protein